MRCDLNILWIDDVQRWQNEQREILQMDIEDLKLTVEFYLENQGKAVLDRIEQQINGFNLYDIILVDYSLSYGVVGDDIINKLRNNNIDCDILFYSTDKSKNIKDISSRNDFEGVYVCNRDNFRDKVLMLIEKNARRNNSILNMRGSLMNQTSENDYIVNSYILSKYGSLSDDDKASIKLFLSEEVATQQRNQEELYVKVLAYLRKEGDINIKKLLKTSSSVITLDLKYKLFEKILLGTNNECFKDFPLCDYLEKIVKKRNTLAHKKIDLCKAQKYIKYYDNKDQFKARQCPKTCSNHTNENKMSIDEWSVLRELIFCYGKCFDKILEEL